MNGYTVSNNRSLTIDIIKINSKKREKKTGYFSILSSVLFMLMFFPLTFAESDKRYSEISVQGGWWNADVEWKSPIGIYSSVGVPWGAWLITFGSIKWLVPFSMRLGYQYEYLHNWYFLSSLHFAGTYGRENIMLDSNEIVTRSYQFIEIGTRYENPSGMILGLDVPLFGFDDAHELFQGKTEGIEIFPPPISFAFTQIYIGYSWQL